MGRLSIMRNGLRDMPRYAVGGFEDPFQITGTSSYSLHEVGKMQNVLPRGSRKCSIRSYHAML